MISITLPVCLSFGGIGLELWSSLSLYIKEKCDVYYKEIRTMRHLHIKAKPYKRKDQKGKYKHEPSGETEGGKCSRGVSGSPPICLLWVFFWWYCHFLLPLKFFHFSLPALSPSLWFLPTHWRCCTMKCRDTALIPCTHLNKAKMKSLEWINAPLFYGTLLHLFRWCFSL